MTSTQNQTDTADPPSTSGAARELPPSGYTDTLAAVILAAGQGTRMRSRRPKVLHPLAGKPLIMRVLEQASRVGASHRVVVVGHRADEVRATLPSDVALAIQEPQLGTGHAVQIAAEALRQRGATRLLVLYGDVVLVRSESLTRLLAQPVGSQAPVALLSAHVPNPAGYGRIIRRPDGTVQAIVEEAEANESERLVNEVHSGIMLLWTPWLWERLHQLPERSKGEFYLTDLVGIANQDGRSVLAVPADEPSEAEGVNDQRQLAEAHRVLWERKRTELMQAGVTLLDPATTYVDPEVEIEADVVVHPGCHLRGSTHIAAGCEIGPNAYLLDTRVGEGSRVWLSVLESAVVGRNANVGPLSHLRPGAVIGDRVYVGNYAEVKGSRIGADTQMHHFSYVGDSEVGERVNVGAGTITANFDGKDKHRTTIEDDVKIGSDTIFVAPVRAGAGSVTGAGAVVTRDVPPGAVVVGVPARRIRRVRTPEADGEGARS